MFLASSPRASGSITTSELLRDHTEVPEGFFAGPRHEVRVTVASAHRDLVLCLGGPGGRALAEMFLNKCKSSAFCINIHR